MKKDKRPLDDQLVSFMNINEQPGPPRFIADPNAREQWIANTVDGAAIEVEPKIAQLMHIAPPQKSPALHGLTKMAIGFGIAACLSLAIAAVFWPSRSPQNQEALTGPGSVVDLGLKERKPDNKETEPPRESPKEELHLEVVITDLGFHFEANPSIRTPWTDHGTTPEVPEYTVPHIPKKDNDWDYAELKRRLGELKELHSQETSIMLFAENNIPYEVLINAMDSSRDASGKPLFPDVALKNVQSWGPDILMIGVVVHYPRNDQEPDESEHDLNLVVAVTDQGFHFKVNPRFRMPWMAMATETGAVGPDIPKKDNDWDFAELERRLGELKDNHSQETSITLGAEAGIPYDVFFKTVQSSQGESDKPLFNHVMLTRLVE